MPTADEFADLGGGVFQWEAYDAQNRVNLSATAAISDGGLYFIDPIGLRKAALAELLESAGAPPAAVLLTNANHARDAGRFRRELGLPVLAAAAAEDVGIALDGPLGAALGGWAVIPLAGAAAGEVALFRAESGGWMVMGDALINLASHPFSLLPDKYCADPRALRRSLAQLLAYDFTKMAFAHGEPVMTGAKERLAALLQA